MKRIQKICIVFIVLCCAGYYLLCGSPIVNWNNDKLRDAVLHMETDTITLEELIPFEWDAVYSFEPYTSREDIAKAIGFDSREIVESNSDHVSYLVFVNDGRIVSNSRDGSIGCYLDIPNWKRVYGIGSWCGYLEYGDNIPFEIAYRNDVMILQAAERGTIERFTYESLSLEISNVHSIRTELYTDPIDPTYQWECKVYTYYPGAEISILNANQHYADDGEAYPTWKIRRVGEDGVSLSETDIIDYSYPVAITKDMRGIYHYESMMTVLKLERFQE